MMRVERGKRRTAKPDIFISHSSRDKGGGDAFGNDSQFLFG